MKRLLLLAALLCSIQLPAPAASVTADELAAHLGVYVWRISQKDLPKKVTISLREIKDGKLANGGSESFTLDGTTDLVVCCHWENQKPIFTFAVGGAVVKPTVADMNAAPFMARQEIEKPAAGPHLLLADYPIKKDSKFPMGRAIDTGNIADVSRGIALIVEE